ncbi:hypothetical protein KFE25_005887 [Diacronema lutheri]|uniref:GDP-fucose protein O-fucosyltransferase 2 n=2 Tax=Diacronema lutheri TaxID=2081491 RepID=A0A8J6CC21_DIALT|nr:hypothetical protein KFE25_005887 [Diacronema lutheri]
MADGRLVRVLLVSLGLSAASDGQRCASPDADDPRQCALPNAGEDVSPDGERFIIAWPCDPGECHIYFGQQRRALPTNLNVARATNRTLVLAPFTWYDGQAQNFTNAFKRTPNGVRPLFTRFSELFDVASLREPLVDGSRVRVLELHEFVTREAAAGRRPLEIELAVMSKGIPSSHARDSRPDPQLDARVIVPYACAQPLEGIALNLSHGGSGELWGLPREHVAVRELRCGYAMLAKAWADAGRRPAAFGARLESDALFGGKRLVALLGAGHQLHSHALDAAATELAERLTYAPHLVAEAERFVREALAPSVRAARAAHELGALGAGDGGGYIAAHWRHGDFVPYGHAAQPDVVARNVAQARRKLPGACPTCPVFLATNCRDREAVADLRAQLAPMPTITYEPVFGPDGDAFRSEGARLSVEMLVAARASVFVRSGRSAVSHFVDVERRRLGLPASASVV